MAHTKKIVLLHSNDMHGDFLAEDVDRKLIGGVSMLSGYVNQVRNEEPNTLYCIAGDMFRGSVIDSEFKGLSTIEIMNMLAPDIVTIGNHEVDYGLAHLLFLEKCAKFPIINANLYIKNNHAHMFRPYHIFEMDGMKILFIGILTEEVMAKAKTEGLVGTFVDVEDAATEVERICNAHNSVDIDLTVLLTHIGIDADRKLAQILDPACGVDVIIGGHSHTFMEAPEVVNDILIVQAGTGTDQIGRFDLTVDTDENRVVDYIWRPVPIDSEHCPTDPELERLIEEYKLQTDEKYGRVVTRFMRKLTHPSRNQETELGAVFADALGESLGVDLFLCASGSIRSTELGPIVMLGDLMTCYPYNDTLHLFEVTGAQLKEMIRYMLRDGVWAGEHTEFYQLSKGWKVVYRKASHDFAEFSKDGREIDDSDRYSVAMEGFHFKNLGDIFHVDPEEIFANKKPRVIGTASRTVIEEYLAEHNRLDHHTGERLIVLE
ncbi:MAG: bifunctional metallophosphatase/5'-nucleotidase [Lachnospiraceae bacterium]|nr:bifunctional metallophosphatase/5'-nucleotidase [Lachnospiraceae bacterium]